MPDEKAQVEASQGESMKPEAASPSGRLNPTVILSTGAQAATIVSIVAGVVISTLSFNATRQQETRALRLQSSQPLLDFQRKLYLETITVATTLADPESHSPEEIEQARARFSQLYGGELYLITSQETEEALVTFARELELRPLTAEQVAALNLAKALGEQYLSTYEVIGW